MTTPTLLTPRVLTGLLGLGLMVFALVVLSGPGRIDIVDGQTRFEVGRSLLEHGDSALRDSRIGWSRFPGRDGQDFSYYRIPQSLVAAGAIYLADATGHEKEGRRHFFFVAAGGVFAGALAIVYAIWFLHLGCAFWPALLWGLGGILCTPSWFYSTSTFDDYLGSTVIVAAAVVARMTCRHSGFAGTLATAVLLGFAFHCKQPLAAYVLLVAAQHDNPEATKRSRWIRVGILLVGVIAGVVMEYLYDRAKFPFDKSIVHAEIHRPIYGPDYEMHQAAALIVSLFGLGSGVIWYFPPLLICLVGWARATKGKWVGFAMLLSSAVVILFLCSLSFFKGDPSWGPRYWTPIFALLWLYAPIGARHLRRGLVMALLGLGILVQLLALSVDPHRLYVQIGASSGFSRINPWLYFHPSVAHLVNRPREIVEILGNDQRAESFTPAPSPTFAFPIIDPPHLPETGPEVVHRYHILQSLRPWWISQRYLEVDERPVPIGRTAGILLCILGVGMVLVATSLRGSRERKPESCPTG